VTVSATTDAAGSWKAALGPEPSDSGDWQVDATYAGDTTHLGSSAPSCSVEYA
jgi:hypothetical protein